MMLPKELDHYLTGEAWTSQETYRNLETLCDFAPRFAGLPGNFAARDFILERFKAYGVADPRADAFDYLVWTRGACALAMRVPGAREFRSAISLVYSPNAARLRAAVVDCGIGSEEDFARVLVGAGLAPARAGQPQGGQSQGGQTQGLPLQNKIAMVTTANPENKPTIHRREKYGRAVAAGAVGFIYVNHKPGMLAETGSLRPGKLAEIPALGISYEDGWELARWCKRGTVEIEMTIQNQAAPGKGYHVVGEIPGKTHETIIVGAHFDGHDISQGAMDDATGTVLVLELARILAPLRGQFARTIRLIAFDAEELGVLGSQEYVNLHRGELGNVALMINLDGAYGPVATHGFATSGFSDTEAILKTYAKDFGYPLVFKDRVVTASDNFPFFMEGLPAICMNARAENPTLGRGWGHTAADTLDKVAEVDVKAAVMTIARMLARLADHAGALGARRTRAEIKQILVERDLERALRAQDKWQF